MKTATATLSNFKPDGTFDLGTVFVAPETIVISLDKHGIEYVSTKRQVVLAYPVRENNNRDIILITFDTDSEMDIFAKQCFSLIIESFIDTNP